MWKLLLASTTLFVAAACGHQHGEPPARPPSEPLPMTSTPETHATFGDDGGLQSTDPMNGAEPTATDAGTGGAMRDGGTATGDGGTATDAGTRRGK